MLAFNLRLICSHLGAGKEAIEVVFWDFDGVSAGVFGGITRTAE